jgi:hypothetical protein
MTAWLLCGLKATTHPEDWCPDAERFDLSQSCKDSCGIWKAKLKDDLTTDRMRTWFASYRPKVAEDEVCVCCGEAATGKGPKSHPDANVRYCNTCRTRGQTWVNGSTIANKPAATLQERCAWEYLGHQTGHSLDISGVRLHACSTQGWHPAHELQGSQWSIAISQIPSCIFIDALVRRMTIEIP